MKLDLDPIQREKLRVFMSVNNLSLDEACSLIIKQALSNAANNLLTFKKADKKSNSMH